ncbi:MAG: hypothetical protein QW356_05410 [Candidatus Hadarchaeales archaeon]
MIVQVGMPAVDPLRRWLTEFSEGEREQILKFYQTLMSGSLQEVRGRVGNRVIVLEPEGRIKIGIIPLARNPNLLLLWRQDSGPFQAKLYFHRLKGTGYLALYGGAHSFYIPLRTREEVGALISALKKLRALMEDGRNGV